MANFSKGLAYQVHNARDGEAQIIESLPRWTPGAESVLVVVPSDSLRIHWIRRLCQARGALLGVDVLTHTRLVRNVWDIAGSTENHSRLWPVQLARQFAATEPVLERALGDIDDGYEVAAQTVEELVNAGLRPEHMDAALECVRGWPAEPM